MNTFPLLTSAHWNLAIAPHTGAIESLQNPSDARRMNWVSNASENPWFLDSHGWGLGFVTVAGANRGFRRWQRADEVTVLGNASRATYRLEGLDVTVKRRLDGNRLVEGFEFLNRTDAELTTESIGIYSPFNDNYPSAAICADARCNAHLWCGGDVAYACCLRMGGEAPHLGMVFKTAYVTGYGVEGRGLNLGSSNQRGAFVFNISGKTLKPGEVQRIEREFFWHTGWDDFFAQARQTPGFLDVRANCYTLVSGHPVEIAASDSSAQIEQPTAALGEQTLKVRYGGKRETWLRINIVPEIPTLLKKRAAFIRDRQQVNDSQSPYNGAFLPYDNDTEAQFRNGNWADQNEGRERLCMGVFLAKMVQRWPDPQTEAALKRYHHFVRNQLQQPDGTVRDGVGGRTTRLYNYSKVALFHMEMFHVFNKEGYLTDCWDTLQAFYSRGGEKLYTIGLPIQDAVETFTKTGHQRQAEVLKAQFLCHGNALVDMAKNIPAHEVNYEQSIVGPGIVIALECYLISREERFLDYARRMMPALEAFNGRQPDHHLNDIAIRHWDGFWFGRKQIWGDTFPHYWSVITAWAFYLYGQATADPAYPRRGREILMNNLSLFSPDGRGYCAYLYPDTVNGSPARGLDPLANDQDWALVFLLKAARLDPSLMG